MKHIGNNTEEAALKKSNLGYVLVLVIMLAIPQIQYLKNKKGYWLAAEDWEQYKEVMGEDL